jgi:hypothetical protein
MELCKHALQADVKKIDLTPRLAAAPENDTQEFLIDGGLS